MTKCCYGPFMGDLVSGALDEHEAAVFDAHADGCASCRQDLAEHLVLWLNEIGPEVARPDHLLGVRP